MHSAGHDGIYLPRVHINKIKKKYQTKLIVPKQPDHQTSLSRHHHHSFFGSLFAPLSLQSSLPLCQPQFFYCSWLMPDRQCFQQPLKDLVVSFGQWRARKESSCNAVHAATHKHLHMHIDDALIWHWIITEVDPPDLFRPIKPFICMLTTEAFPGRPLRSSDTTHCDVTGAQWDVRRQNTKAPLVPCFCLSRRMECGGVYQGKRSNHQYASYKHTAVTCTRLKGKKTTGDNERLTRAVFVLSAHLVRLKAGGPNTCGKQPVSIYQRSVYGGVKLWLWKQMLCHSIIA